MQLLSPIVISLSKFKALGSAQPTHSIAIPLHTPSQSSTAVPLQTPAQSSIAMPSHTPVQSKVLERQAAHTASSVFPPQIPAQSLDELNTNTSIIKANKANSKLSS